MNIRGYVRVSSAGQMEGDGPERQSVAILAFCAAHKLPTPQIYQEAVTGTKESLARPVFSSILDMGPGVIVVERMDRLARDLMISELLLRECTKRKIVVYAADQGATVDMAGNSGKDPTRTLIRQVLGAVAEFEKASLVAKMNAARERIKARTGKCGGAHKFGELEGESRVLQLMKDFLKSGNSLNQVAGLLNEAGFKTRFGKPWTKLTVWNVTK